MKKIILLLPVYNDWESLIKVLSEIDTVIQNIKNYEFSCVIVNDCSSVEKPKIILCSFDKKFLDMPKEIIIITRSKVKVNTPYKTIYEKEV